jgi:hypothetical protein
MSGIFKLFSGIGSGIGSRVDETTRKRLDDELKGLYEEQNNQVKTLSDISKKIDEVKEKISNMEKGKSEKETETETKSAESQAEPPSPEVKDETQPAEQEENKTNDNNFLGFNLKNPFGQKESQPQQTTESLVKPVEEPEKDESPVQPAAVQPAAVQPAAVQPVALQPQAGLQSPPPNAVGFAAPGEDAENFNTGFGESGIVGGKKNKNKKQKKTKSKTQSGGKKRRTRRNKQKELVYTVSVEDI